MDEYISQKGVVTFLDVLGWKGIWQRKNDAINDLENLVKSITKTLPEAERGISKKQTSIMIVSDTIVIFTPTESDNISKVIELHGKLCKEAIPLSIKKGIPLRGATSFGDVVLNKGNNIFAGKAIDEAAAWHDKSDWIGVFLTPSAEFIFNDSNSEFWVLYPPPLKSNIELETHSAQWILESDNTDKINEIKSDFIQLSPIIPEIVLKFTNTLRFLKSIIGEL